MPQHEALKAGLDAAESIPPGHHLAYRLPGSKPQVEPGWWAVSPGRDSGDYAEPLAPVRNLESGNGTWLRRLADG
jgi:hypothetical protein